jgi:hypothetical protein
MNAQEFKNCGKAKKTALLINLCRLDCRDLMAAKALTDNVQPARQRRIAKSAVRLAGEGGTG